MASKMYVGAPDYENDGRTYISIDSNEKLNQYFYVINNGMSLNSGSIGHETGKEGQISLVANQAIDSLVFTYTSAFGDDGYSFSMSVNGKKILSNSKVFGEIKYKFTVPAGGVIVFSYKCTDVYGCLFYISNIKIALSNQSPYNPKTEGIARLVSKMYIGVDGIARRIKKAYIGAGGVAKLFFDAGKFIVRKQINISLSKGRDLLSAAPVGDYIIFAGGASSGNRYENTVDCFNNNFTSISISPLTTGQRRMGSCSIDGYAFFGGGETGSSASDEIVVYRTNLNANILNLSSPKKVTTGARIGNSAVFYGGNNKTEIINDNLTITSLTSPFNISYSKGVSVLNSNNEYIGAIFTGGYDLNSSFASEQRAVYYNSSFTYQILQSLNFDLFGYSGARAGENILFCENGNIYAFSPSLTLITGTSISRSKSFFGDSAASLDEYAVFYGGIIFDQNNNRKYYKVADIIDSSLTMSTEYESYIDLIFGNLGCSFLAGASFGDYTVFGGGVRGNYDEYVSDITVFKMSK